tara:strand:+ start:2059 stop:2667 length:609 start_codon:yes stop_codon:yes gene_type:complete
MKLIREYYELCDGGTCQDLLTEAEKREVAEGAMYLSGCMQKCNTKNANGRIYEKKTLFREVDRYKDLVKARRALGELDHPESSVISLERCSHMVTEIWTDGDDVMGKIKVLQELPMGSVLAGLIKEGVTCGISSRGTGSIREENGTTMVEDDFSLICFDMVSDPSTPGAFMLREAREIYNNGKGDTNVDRIIDRMLDKYGAK